MRVSPGGKARISASPRKPPARPPAPSVPKTVASPSGSAWGVVLRMRTACKGCRAARSWTHQIRSAGSRTSRKGTFAVSPLRIETGSGNARATRPAEASATAAAAIGAGTRAGGGIAEACGATAPAAERGRAAISAIAGGAAGGGGGAPVSGRTATCSDPRTGMVGRATSTGV
jgi:hypothetical protein